MTMVASVVGMRRDGCDRLLFSSCIGEAVSSLSGGPETALFKRSTGLSETTFRNSGLKAVLGKKRKSVEKHLAIYWLKQARKNGAPEATEQDLVEALAGLPFTPVRILARFTTSGGESPMTVDLADRMNTFDLRISNALAAGGNKEAWALLRGDLALGAAYRRRLPGTSLPSWPSDDCSLTRENLEGAIAIYRANMALSLLAMTDHDVVGHLVSWTKSETWAGVSLFTNLLADCNDRSGGKRLSPNDPIVRLLEFICAAGMHIANRKWPTRRPSLADMVTRAKGKRSYQRTGSVEVFMKKLRSGRKQLTVDTLREFVACEIVGPSDPEWLVLQKEIATVFNPMLLVAHLLCTVIPESGDRPRHRAMAGWQPAYLKWWVAHAERRGLPTKPRASALPPWITGTQSSSLSRPSQSAGRSS